MIDKNSGIGAFKEPNKSGEISSWPYTLNTNLFYSWKLFVFKTILAIFSWTSNNHLPNNNGFNFIVTWKQILLRLKCITIINLNIRLLDSRLSQPVKLSVFAEEEEEDGEEENKYTSWSRGSRVAAAATTTLPSSDRRARQSFSVSFPLS